MRLHGFEPGTVTPTTELLLAHKHPDNYREVSGTIDLIRQTRRAFRSRHRIHNVHGKVPHVAVLGDGLRDQNRQVIGPYGFYVDLTAEAQTQQQHMTAEPARIAERRSTIEQARTR
ncbi:hypothetical protein ACQ856_29595 (plasmid) [Mycolicibacterium psychrotolerans]|uniref:hypothetical protein n=1 Tax=Mycolicibacterium psychrotolerans TaxID=216929 RepID=UPI003D67F88A